MSQRMYRKRAKVKAHVSSAFQCPPSMSMKESKCDSKMGLKVPNSPGQPLVQAQVKVSKTGQPLVQAQVKVSKTGQSLVQAQVKVSKTGQSLV